MNYPDIITALCTAIGTVLALYKLLEKRFDRIENRFDKVDERLSSLEQRTSKLEGEMEHQKGMLQTIVGFLIGSKTGTERH